MKEIVSNNMRKLIVASHMSHKKVKSKKEAMRKAKAKLKSNKK